MVLMTSIADNAMLLPINFGKTTTPTLDPAAPTMLHAIQDLDASSSKLALDQLNKPLIVRLKVSVKVMFLTKPSPALPILSHTDAMTQKTRHSKDST